MKEILYGLALFGTGSMFGALIVGFIWARDFLRKHRAQGETLERSELRESRALAILEAVHKEDIKEFSEEIQKTQELRRSRPLDV